MIAGLRTILLLGLGALVLYAMQHNTPGYGDITSPIAIRGKAGERVESHAFAYGAANVHLARALKTESFGRVRDYSSSGVWLVIEGAAVAKKESLTLLSAGWLSPSGIRYALSQRFSTMRGYLPTERLEPGLPKPVLVAFELPETAISGGRLLIARSGLTPLGEELWIALDQKAPLEIKPSITLARGSGSMPWTLAAK
ncbi:MULTISPECIES: hypothetical protein [unclassified Ensifer]|uniref:hypothetical protein n=1 Tax=unclassified Ensifer TaxID=2633371 RepID=UPI00070FC00E|nr:MULTISPECIES: hypothetical protein [unclassified Ensifer]KQW61596.1 hypothetical protein ASD02_21715 [Ensifer sp. Root1252]KRC54360.1 hypothetical protein ASE32_22895 [Ensifer sp. Root231]KRD01695.1 hypothetical protein ASE47_22270 [Ensifer sp. Root258]